MSYFYFSLFLSCLFLLICWYTRRSERALTQENTAPYLVIILFAGLLVRCVLGLFTKGYETDISCFTSWSYHVFENGFSNFYDSIGFCDYPPGYLYILYVLGFIAKIFGMSYESAGYVLMLKLPAILCDCALCALVYHFAKQEKAGSLTLPMLFAFSPALIMTSAVWGQVDAVLCILLLVCLICGIDGKLELATIFFTLAALTKPQAFMFAPLVMVLFAFHDKVMFRLPVKPTSRKATILLNYLLTFVFSLFIFYILSVPFFGLNCLPGLIEKYYSTFSSYAYATVNALNLNFLAGGNWADLDTPFLLLTFRIWSTLFLLGSVFVTVWLLARTKEKKAVFLVAGIFLLSVFTLTAKMHERYFFLCVFLFAFAYVIHQRKEIFVLFSGISVTYFLNLVLAYIDQVNHIPATSDWGMLISLANILLMIYAYVIYFKLYPLPQKECNDAPFLREKRTRKMVKRDYLLLAVITLVYSVVAFIHLGDTVSPQTGISLQQGDVITITPAPGTYDALLALEGMELGDIDINGSADGETYEKIADFEKRSVFSWKRFELNRSYQKIQLVVEKIDNDYIDLLEIGLIDAKTKKAVPPVSVTLNGEEITALSDEQQLVPPYPTYLNGTYFDEIYHARTAYELNHDLPIYENTHPQLGKLMIALGIKLFGMTPFGYRCMGTLFGILMLPLLYLFIKRMFRSSFVATVGTILFAADFMHFTQTRIATIDVFIVFFVILMYYFMYRFYEQSTQGIHVKKYVLYLFLSGLMFALGISAKWTGAYAGVGLALIYALSLRNIYRQTKAENKPFIPLLLTLLACGVGFFVVLPAVIYFVVFIPYFICMKDPINLDSFLRINTHMFQYHSGLNDTHPFASKWYQWMLNLKPIWYYQTLNPYIASSKGTIAAFGNPLVWLGGFAALIGMGTHTVKTKNSIGIFILIAYIVQILPWIPVAEARTTFIYHYFPAVPFLILGICYVIDRYLQRQNHSKNSVLAVCFGTGATVLLFVLYYPILSGMECSEAYINALKLLPTWIF